MFLFKTAANNRICFSYFHLNTIQGDQIYVQSGHPDVIVPFAPYDILKFMEINFIFLFFVLFFLSNGYLHDGESACILALV